MSHHNTILSRFVLSSPFARLSGLLVFCLACLSSPAQANVIKGYALGSSASYQQVNSNTLADIAVSYDDSGLVSSAWFAFGGQTLRADFGKGGIPFLTGLKFGTSTQSLGFDPGTTSLQLSGKTFAAGQYGAVLQALVDQVVNPLDIELTDFTGCQTTASPCAYGLLGLGGSRQANQVTAAAILFGTTGALVDNAVFQRSQIDDVRANAGYVAFSAQAIPQLTAVSAVPEPDSLGMVLLGLVALTFRHKMAKAKRASATV